MYDEKTKLWKVKYDNNDTEEKTFKQVIVLKKRYEQQKQYDTEANTKLPATTTTVAPTLPRSKKKESTVAKKKTPAKKKKPLTKKQQKEFNERLPQPKLLNNDGDTVMTNDNYTGDVPSQEKKAVFLKYLVKYL